MRCLLAAAAAAAMAAPAQADMEAVDRLFGLIDRTGGRLALCREPHYPAGDCLPAAYTSGQRYRWVRGVDAGSNERLSLTHDADRDGNSAVFRSNLEGYTAMYLGEHYEDPRCLEEFRVDAPPVFHLRLGGFREIDEERSGRRVARYGLYAIVTTRFACEALRLGVDDLLDG